MNCVGRYAFRVLAVRELFRHAVFACDVFRYSQKNDVYVVSYPRSGNTLCRFLLAGAIAGTEDLFATAQRHVPDLHQVKRKACLQAQKPPRLFKSHHALFTVYPKTIYVYRDGRDAAWSFHHLNNRKLVQEGHKEQTFSRFLPKVAGKSWFWWLPSWQQHVGLALEFSRQHPDRILLVKYEDLIANKSYWLQKMLTFCNVSASEESIAEACKACDMQNMQKIERETFPKADMVQDLNHRMFRAGTTGQHWANFSHEDRELFHRHAGGMLAHLGYPINKVDCEDEG